MPKPARPRRRRVERWLGHGILVTLLLLAGIGWVKVLGGIGALIAFAAAALFVGIVALSLRPLVDLVFSQHRAQDRAQEAKEYRQPRQ